MLNAKTLNDIDPECVELCDSINRISGLETFSSCCGHDKTDFHIQFHLKDKSKVNNLNVISRALDCRYHGPLGWSCSLINMDVCERMPAFSISSGEIKGQRAYKESIKIAKDIKDLLTHEKFIECFNIQLK